MKIFNTAQIRAWDQDTITNEPVASVELMNRAARAFTRWFTTQFPHSNRPVVVIAGTGNNGGDGLAVARYLHQHFYNAKVLVYNFGENKSADFEAQVLSMPPLDAVQLVWCDQAATFPEIPPGAVLIDALFGSGLNRPLQGNWAKVVEWINQLPNEVVSIDMPSGLFADQSSMGSPVVHADRTFSFETPKRAFFFPENADRVGEWSVGSIGLHPDFVKRENTPFHFLTASDIRPLYLPRKKYTHKGSFGHALLVAGSYGKMGAAVLAARACLRSGVGLLTVHAPRSGFLVLQSAVPEAMFSPDHRAIFCTEIPEPAKYTTIGIGPGLGTAPETKTGLKQLLQKVESPMVIDADALNIISDNPSWWNNIPENSILTPHPKEFERLFGRSENDFERNDLQRHKAREHKVFIILKGAHTAIAAPDGDCWFNSTGNPGMATGGSGDVLTGILTGLLAQGYPSLSACLLGVFVHGLAGDLAAADISREALTAGDLVAYVGKAWKAIE
ncbi:MAG: NAD(P)H-hydrate dehydratase [Saprospiraceae bacterium]|nr:NAD(P)H-hydrate dehydratase [Saprospiraceae bacterium]